MARVRFLQLPRGYKLHRFGGQWVACHYGQEIGFAKSKAGAFDVAVEHNKVLLGAKR